MVIMIKWITLDIRITTKPIHLQTVPSPLKVWWKNETSFSSCTIFLGGMRNCSWCSCLNMWGNRFLPALSVFVMFLFPVLSILRPVALLKPLFWREQPWNSNIDIFRLCKTHSKSKEPKPWRQRDMLSIFLLGPKNPIFNGKLLS